MTKFHMRRDYAARRAAARAAPHLSGDKAAEAAFHGARALSRVDRDDEAIAGYKKVVEPFPRSRWAAEAQYLSGWLDYNRGRFRESLPGLQATLDHFGKSAFADDAAWCLAFAHLLLGDADEAFAGLARYAKHARDGHDRRRARRAVAYWRARLYEKIGRKDGSGAKRRLPRAARRRPLSVLRAARRRARSRGGRPKTCRMTLPAEGRSPTSPPGSTPSAIPDVARVLELLDAGMNVEAGDELEREREGRSCSAPAATRRLPWLLGLYRRAEDFHRAYQLRRVARRRRAGGRPHADGRRARVLGGGLSRAPTRELVEKYGPPGGQPRRAASTRSCARSRGSTRTTSRTPTRAGSCR